MKGSNLCCLECVYVIECFFVYVYVIYSKVSVVCRICGFSEVMRNKYVIVFIVFLKDIICDGIVYFEDSFVISWMVGSV